MARPTYGEPYDPAIRKTEHGSRIYTAWKKLRRYPYYEPWTSFPVFYEWSLKNGYAPDTQFLLTGDTCEYYPGTCLWTHPQIEPPVNEWVIKWNETVNRIRKYYGMPPVEEIEHEHEHE